MGSAGGGGAAADEEPLARGAAEDDEALAFVTGFVWADDADFDDEDVDATGRGSPPLGFLSPLHPMALTPRTTPTETITASTPYGERPCLFLPEPPDVPYDIVFRPRQ